MDLLIHMLNNSQRYSVLVFSRTKRGADKINRRLKRAGVVSVAIHSGRTGRATALGDAITFVSYDEQKYIRKIESFIGREIKSEKCEGFAYTKSDSLQPQSTDKSKSVRHTGPRKTTGRKLHASRRRRRKVKRR